MRELLFKALTSEDRTRKDLTMSETVENNGLKTVTRRHSLYIIGDHHRITDPQELLDWQAQPPKSADRRHIFIFKKQDRNLKKDSFICDVVGKFYAVVKGELYSIAFKHSFEIDFLFAQDK